MAGVLGADDPDALRHPCGQPCAGVGQWPVGIRVLLRVGHDRRTAGRQVRHAATSYLSSSVLETGKGSP